MERIPDTHWSGNRVGPAAGLDAVEEKKLRAKWVSTKFACLNEVYRYVNCSGF
jgi:hypothetical protein